MNEKYVQVPVSLIDDLAAALEAHADHAYCQLGVDDEDYKSIEKVRALLSQPAPTAEPEHDEACIIWTGDGFTCDCGDDDDSRTEPPRIEDMAPGTAFTAKTPTGWRRCLRATGFGVYVAEGQWDLSRIDPSTIRDVQPPKDAA